MRFNVPWRFEFPVTKSSRFEINMSIPGRKYAQRLMQMTWDEFRVRTAQEINKRCDALYFGRLQSKTRDYAALRGRFFFSAEELSSIVALILERMPRNVASTIEQAERICRHEFDLLGYERLRYGASIDWHLDAVSGKRGLLKPWFKVRYLDYKEVGDAKVTWELNRHQHLVTLAKAYRFGREERFVTELLSQWYSWREQNPYPMGMNWASSLEVAFRAISWLWILHLLENCPAVPSTFKSDVNEALLLSGRHIERYRSTYFSPNTHLLGEGVALFFLGLLCKGRSTERWKQLGWDIVATEAQRQVRADGVHFEQSTYYHVYAVDMFLHARILAAANGISTEKELDPVIQKMLEALCVIARAGVVPRFGDDDGGRLFDPHRNRVEHLLDPLSTGAVLFQRADFKAVKPVLVEETAWLLGAEVVRKFDGISATSVSRDSIALRSSGLYVMPITGEPESRLVMDAGPHGVYGGGHGHADALSVQVAAGGREVLVDPGTFAYVSRGSERQLFRGTASHNTVQIDGLDQADAGGPFPWRRFPEVRVEKCVFGESFDLIVASHNGYEVLANPVTHRRCVFSDKSKFWFILDMLEGRGTHSADLFWHLAPRLQCLLGTGVAQVVSETGGVGLIFPQTQNWKPQIRPGWYSPVYGRRIESEVLSFHCQTAFPQQFATVVLPLADSSGTRSLGSIRQEFGDDLLLAYSYDCAPEANFFFFSAGVPWTWRELHSDAAFLYYSSSESGSKRLVMCGGSYVEVDHEALVACSRSVPRFEWSRENSRERFSCSDEAAVSSISIGPLAALECWTGITQ